MVPGTPYLTPCIIEYGVPGTPKRLVGPIPLPAEPRGLAFRPDGRALAVVCADYRVVLVDPATGSIRQDLDPGIRTRPLGANLWTTNGEALFSSDGRYLLTWERVPTLHVWNPDDGRLLQTLEHTERVEHAAFNPQLPHILATGGRDSMVKAWDLSAGKLLKQLQHPKWIQKIAFSPDGSELISGCNDGLIRSWNWRNGELNRALPHNVAMFNFDFTTDRRWLTVHGATSLQLTDWRSGAPAAPEWNLGNGLFWGGVIAAGDRRVVVGGFEGRMIRDPRTCKASRAPTIHGAWVRPPNAARSTPALARPECAARIPGKGGSE